MSVHSPELLPPSGGDFERLREIYKDIMGFVKSHMSTELEFTEVGWASTSRHFHHCIGLSTV